MEYNKETVYQELKEKILKGEISSGQQLVERDIAEEYNISRTPIREVLWMLLSDGFLERSSHKGYMVREMNLIEILSIYQTREAIEGIATRIACLKGDNTFYEKLREIKDRLENIEIDSDTCAKGITYGRQLHNAIIDATGNFLLKDFSEKINNLTALTTNLIRRNSPFIEEKSRSYHLEIINSLEDRDEEMSVRLMQEHLRNTCQQLANTIYPDLYGNY